LVAGLLSKQREAESRQYLPCDSDAVFW